MEKDPVCDMDVVPEESAGKSEYKGITYYFCSVGCKKAFDAEPRMYVKHVHGPESRGTGGSKDWYHDFPPSY